MNKILLISFCLTLCPYLLPLIYGQDITSVALKLVNVL